MIGIIFLVVLLSTLWTAVIVLGLPWAIAIVPTIAVAAAAGGIFAYRRIQARQAAQAIEKTLKAQGDEYAKQVRPDQQPEIEGMQAEFSKAVASLKGSKLARGGSDALSVLPWYLIVGPPGVGKSTALRNSGLQFPYLSARGGGVRGVGGTRNCEWWLTNEAVILDTAGRYMTEDDDQQEWFAFLDMLAKNRPKKPVNGLLVAVSVGELAQLDEEAAAALGQRIRERVDEVMIRLKMILPVYVMFNKCDLLAGFVEMFGDLPKGERGQIWGSTEPVAAKSGSASEVFAARFDELALVIEETALKRIGQVRRMEDRERVFQFPAQFEGLRGNLTEFIRTLFAENVYQDTPVMRGLYFSSATQEGQPIDRMMNAMASAFGIRGALPDASEGAVETKSYFLQDFFSRVLFKDQGLAVLSTKENKRQRVLRYAYSAAGFGVAALVMLFPTISFFNNRELLQTTREIVTSVKGGANEGAANSMLGLVPLRERLESLLEGRPGLSMGFGMYQGNALLDSLSQFYGQSVRRVLVAPVIRKDLGDLQEYVAQRGNTPGQLSPKEALPYFHKLKLYLLLSTPRDKAEPALGEVEQAWAARQLTAVWTAQPGISPKVAKATAAHAEMYLKLLSRDRSLAVPRDDNIVASSRRVLRRLPAIEPVLEQLIDDSSDETSDLALAGLLDAPLPALKGSGQIRGAFTRKVYRERICGNFVNRMKSWDAWVTSEQAPPDPETSAQELRSRYFHQYVAEWRQFLDSLTMEGPRDDTQALVILDDLTKGDPPPLGQLFRNVAANVRLTEREKIVDIKDAKGTLERGLEKLKGVGSSGSAGICHEDTERQVDNAFEPFVSFGAPAITGAAAGAKKKEVPLDLYQEQLQAVRDALRARQDVSARVQTATTHVRSLIENQEPTWRQRFVALLLPPLEKTKQVDVAKKSGEMSQKWCSEVYGRFKKNLRNRYPFNQRGPDAAIADLTDFFGPIGTVWSFYDKELKADVVRIGDRFAFAKGLGVEASSVYRRELLNFLTRAQEVRNVLFPSNTAEAQLSFQVHMQPVANVASVTLTVDGQSYTYSNGPEQWFPMKWPMVGKAPGASIVVRSSRDSGQLRQGGDWGFFHLLEEGTVRPSRAGNLTVSWHFPTLNAEVIIDFKPARNETLFGVLKDGQKPQLLQAFRSPGIDPPVAAGYNAGGCTK